MDNCWGCGWWSGIHTGYHWWVYSIWTSNPDGFGIWTPGITHVLQQQTRYPCIYCPCWGMQTRETRPCKSINRLQPTSFSFRFCKPSWMVDNHCHSPWIILNHEPLTTTNHHWPPLTTVSHHQPSSTTNHHQLSWGCLESPVLRRDLHGGPKRALRGPCAPQNVDRLPTRCTSSPHASVAPKIRVTTEASPDSWCKKNRWLNNQLKWSS